MNERLVVSLSCTLLMALAASGPLVAFSYVHVADPSLTRQAELIVRVEVVDSTVDVLAGTIWTRHTMWVDDVIKGNVDGAWVTVRVPGGRSDSLGLELRYHGAPEFVAGEKALLFLRRNSDGSYRVLHFALGAFWEREEHGVPIFVRPLPEPEETTGGALEVGRDAGRFIAWLRDASAGRQRARDYLVAVAPERPAAGSSKFTVFPVFQAWDEFQTKPVRRVTWQRHKRGQEGVPRKGKRELKKVFSVLNKTPDSRGRDTGLVDLALKGTVKKIPSVRCNGDNLFVFEDASGVIGEGFACAADSGGPLAVGGSCRFTTPSGVWKGREVHFSSSARVVFNKGTDCYYRGDPPFNHADTASNKFAEVAIHEVLHTLGLVHSCGDSTSPDCRTSAVLDDATMRARAHADGRGAQLREDDLAGFWFLYDPDFLAAPCHLPPGDRNFCKECGPCGEGQGACRKHSHCFEGLKCKRDAAAGFKTCQ